MKLMGPTDGVAIVGMGCILPRAHTPAQFWRASLRGDSALRSLDSLAGIRVEDLEWNDGRPIVAAPVGDFAFDWKAHRLPPRDAAHVNATHLMLLEATQQALHTVLEVPRPSSMVIVGASGLGLQPRNMLGVRAESMLAAVEGAVTPDRAAAARARVAELVGAVDADSVINALPCIAAGRVASRFDLSGGHYAIDCGAASGLAALERAALALRDGAAELAIVATASPLLTPFEVAAHEAAGVLSSTTCRPFEMGADGIQLGEGCAAFALMRVEDALARQQSVLAVLRSIGWSGEGVQRDLITPCAASRGRAVASAYAECALDPATVDLVVCDAAGNPAGDTAELAVLSEVFADASSVTVDAPASLTGRLGAGHAGVSLLRAVLALRHRLAPGRVGAGRLREPLAGGMGPLTYPGEPTYLRAPRDRPLRAGVSAFGAGGASFHAVLDSAPTPVPRRSSGGRRRRARIAVIGMGGTFPNGESVPAFWQSLLAGEVAIENPVRRWQPTWPYGDDRDVPARSYTRLGAALPDDVLEGTADMDLSQRLALTAARSALVEAGWMPGAWRADRVGVLLGAGAHQGHRFAAEAIALWPLVRRALADVGGSLHAVEAAVCDGRRLGPDTLLSVSHAVTAARIAKTYGFTGRHATVSAACASTLVAVAIAAASLEGHACDVVLAGGVSCELSADYYVGCSRFNALSATGSRPFDAEADGFVPGEGGAILVLKRLEDAERDGDRVHAVLAGTGISGNGAGVSLLAPNMQAEARAMRRALDAGDVPSATVDYLECHGTGTALGDALELEAAADVYGAQRERPLHIGSVKSNIGHLGAGAGAPALVKSVLAVRDGVIPPTVSLAQPCAALTERAHALAPVLIATDWPARDGGIRRAGVNGFGVGGINAHAIVERHVATRNAGGVREVPRVAVAARQSVAECVAALDAIAVSEDFLAALADRGHPTGAVRLAIAAEGPAELREQLELLTNTLDVGRDPALLRPRGIFLEQRAPEGPVALLFPGQGPHYAGMLRELSAAFPVVEQSLTQLDEAYVEIAGQALTPEFLPGYPDGDPREQHMHCAVFAANLALARLLGSWGVSPRALIGQSAGELTALVVAGALDERDALRLLHIRTQAVLRLDARADGATLFLGCGAERAEELLSGLPGTITLAADNGPEACLVSGQSDSVAALAARCSTTGVLARKLPLSRPYHSPLIHEARAAYRSALDDVAFAAPRLPVFSSVTGTVVRGSSAATMRALLEAQLTTPVRLTSAVQAAYAAGARTFVECGPKWPLTTYVRSILRGAPHVAQATCHPKIGERMQAYRALACLWARSEAVIPPDAPRGLKENP